jgi:hypothetical protein
MFTSCRIRLKALLYSFVLQFCLNVGRHSIFCTTPRAAQRELALLTCTETVLLFEHYSVRSLTQGGTTPSLLCQFLYSRSSAASARIVPTLARYCAVQENLCVHAM